MRLFHGLALLSALAVATAAGAQTASADFRLPAPSVASKGGLTKVSGAVCRPSLGRPGAAEVAIHRLDSAGHEIGVSPARIYGAQRGRLGGCAYYAAEVPASAGEQLKVCASSTLDQSADRCIAIKN